MMTVKEIQTLWRELPLSPANDFETLDAQIEKNPKVWQTVAQFLQTANLSALPLGRNEIGEGAFANVQEYETKRESKYELHRRYIDVQLLAAGEETIFVADKEMGREPQGEFDVQNDFILFAEADNARRVTVSPQSWLILYPSDAHKPCMTTDGVPRAVRKIVVKIPFSA